MHSPIVCSVFSSLVCASLTVPVPPPAKQERTIASDEVILHRAALRDVASVDALFLLKRSSASTVRAFESRVLAHRGKVFFSDATVGYLRARLSPLAYRQLSGDRFVESSRLDAPQRNAGSVEMWRPSGGGSRTASAVERRTLDASKLNESSPEFSSQFVGTIPFRAAHPSYDGRGVGIAEIEGVGGLDRPEFSKALDAQGKATRKTSGVVASFGFDTPESVPGNEPLFASDEGSSAFSVVKISVDATRRFAAFGREFHAPSPGAYFVAEETVGAGFYVNTKQKVAVLWHRGVRHAWVDVEGDGDFSAVKPIGDFNQTGEIGHLTRLTPPKKPDTGDERRNGGALAFLVRFDSRTGQPKIYGADNGHHIPVGAYAAGHNFLGTNAGSPAPMAHLVYVSGSGLEENPRRVSEIVEGILEAAEREDMDVLTSSTTAADIEQSDYSLIAKVLNRVIERHKKPIFWAAFNDSGVMETVEGPSTAHEVMSVGAYVNRATVRSLSGYDLPREDYVTNYSRGPSHFGAMKPDVIAPSFGLAPTTCAAGPDYHAPAAAQPPPCYYAMAGTSGATPQAASVAAALISGAKQAGIPHDAKRIRWAMKASAHFLPDWPAHAQGAGLVNLPGAWELLERSAKLPEWRIAPEIEISAPLNHQWLESVPAGTRGVGLYEREGWTPGQTGERTITLTRRHGPKGLVKYKLAWLGDDGTFALKNEENEVSLPLNEAVELPLHIQAETPGVHSAILMLVDEELNRPVDWISAVVVAAHQLTEQNSYHEEAKSKREFLLPAPYFVHVPEGAQVLRVDATSDSGSFDINVNPPLNVEPLTVPNASDAPGWYLTDFKPGTTATRVYASPMKGVWEFNVTEHGSPYEHKVSSDMNVHSIRFTALAASVSAQVTEHADDSVELRLTLANRMGALGKAADEVQVGAREEREIPKATAGTPYISQFYVYPGAEMLRVSVKAKDGTTPLRLYLYNCTDAVKQVCKLWDVPFGTTEDFTIQKPDPGAWRVIAGVAGRTEEYVPYTLTYLQTNARYGTATLETRAQPRKTGELWEDAAQVQFHPQEMPPRSNPVAVVEIRDEEEEEAERKSLGGNAEQRNIPVGTAVVRLQ